MEWVVTPTFLTQMVALLRINALRTPIQDFSFPRIHLRGYRITVEGKYKFLISHFFYSHSKAVFYKPDGTGRDFYITTNHGGFMEKFDQRNVTEKFDDGLRKHSIKTLKNNKAIQRDSLLNFNKRNNSLSKSFVVSKNDG